MSFDLIVIGSGPAGQRAALQGAKAGKTVAIIEEYKKVGGGCVHFGTIPSKSFRESVYRWSLGSRGTLGQETEHHANPETHKRREMPEIGRLFKRAQRVITAESDVIQAQLKRNNIKIVQGRARLVSKNEVEIQHAGSGKKEILEATIIILAPGARPIAPKHLAVDGEMVLDSNSILDLKDLPKRMVVLGAGIIGCEYASMFAMAGTQVYLVDRRHEILANVDRQIVNQLVDRFVAQGVEIILQTEATKIEKDTKSKTARVHLANGRVVETEVVLISLGRAGNTEDMGLAEVGVALDERGLIQVDKEFRTSIPNIYAVGDVKGQPALASTGMEEGRIACCNAFQIENAHMPAVFPYGIYTIPEISMLGRTEEELVAAKEDFVVGLARYSELARGQIVGDRWGILKLLVDRKTQKLLGAHIVGDNAAELIHIAQVVMAFEGTVNYFIKSVFNYPTLAEAYKTAAFHAVNQIRLSQGRPAASPDKGTA